MKKKTLVIVISSVIAVSTISGIVFTKISTAGGQTSINPDSSQVSSTSSGVLGNDNSDNKNGDFTYIPPTLADGNNLTGSNVNLPVVEEETEVPFVPNREMDLDPASITVFVNKEFCIPKDYKPENLVVPNIFFNFTFSDERSLMRPEAAVALEKLFNAAKEDGYILSGISGYRSYDRQYKIFRNNIITKGKEHTLKFSAVPGTSEHQTGLAIDVSAKSLDYKLSSILSKMPEGIWLAENAHHFGYIIRYPKGKASITGYSYEPWHIRYVGIGLATYLYENDLTLDEYYNYTPSKDFDFETLYAALINYVAPNATIIPIDGEVVIIGEDGEIIEGDLDGTEGEDGAIPDDKTSDKPNIKDPSDLPTKEGEDGEEPLPGLEAPTDGETDPADSEGENTDPTGDGTIDGTAGTPTPTVIPTVIPTVTPTVTPAPDDINSSGTATPTLVPTSDDTIIQ